MTWWLSALSWAAGFMWMEPRWWSLPSPWPSVLLVVGFVLFACLVHGSHVRLSAVIAWGAFTALVFGGAAALWAPLGWVMAAPVLYLLRVVRSRSAGQALLILLLSGVAGLTTGLTLWAGASPWVPEWLAIFLGATWMSVPMLLGVRDMREVNFRFLACRASGPLRRQLLRVISAQRRLREFEPSWPLAARRRMARAWDTIESLAEYQLVRGRRRIVPAHLRRAIGDLTRLARLTETRGGMAQALDASLFWLESERDQLEAEVTALQELE